VCRLTRSLRTGGSQIGWEAGKLGYPTANTATDTSATTATDDPARVGEARAARSLGMQAGVGTSASDAVRLVGGRAAGGVRGERAWVFIQRSLRVALPFLEHGPC
jgi:hypothetical protein